MDLHIVHVSFLRPLLKVLADAGASIAKMVYQSGLDRFDMDSSQSVVPLTLMHQFMEQVQLRETYQDLVPEFANAYKLENVPIWGDQLLSNESILSVMESASAPRNRIMSNNTVTFSVDGPITRFSTAYSHRKTPTQEWVDQLSVMLTLDGFRAAMGDQWFPSRLDLTTSRADNFERMFDLSQVDLRLNQSEVAFYCNSQIIYRPLLNSKHGDIPFSALGSDPRSALFQLLDSKLPENALSLDRLAEIYGVNPRTIQRSFAAHNTSFQSVLDAWRRTRALELLSQTNKDLSEISFLLRYNNAPNFLRAFRRWTGTTPSTFRASLHG